MSCAQRVRPHIVVASLAIHLAIAGLLLRVPVTGMTARDAPFTEAAGFEESAEAMILAHQPAPPPWMKDLVSARAQ